MPGSTLKASLAALLLAVLLVALPAGARTLMTQQQALARTFPADARVIRETLFLTPGEVRMASDASGLMSRQQLVVRYKGIRGTAVIGYAYFDTHLVRTLPEVVMVFVSPSQKIDRIEILSFGEPMDYLPRPRWLEQFRQRGLDEELSLKRAIHPISGASLTARAITNASRRILAIHQTIEKRAVVSAPAQAIPLP